MRVLVVEDHKLFADAIFPVLESRGLEMLPLATTVREAMRLAREGRPEVVLVDIDLPDGDGLELGESLLEEMPELKVLVVTASEDPEMVTRAIRAGFSGYITKDLSIERFLISLDSALEGQVVIPRYLARAADTGRGRGQDEASILASHLTPREREILHMLVEGAGGPEIAEKLSISTNTVRTHIQNILIKLQVHTRLEAAALAVRHNLVNQNSSGSSSVRVRTNT